MKNREELLISRGSKDLLQFTKTRIAKSYTSWSPNSLSLSLARDLSQLVSLSQFQTQPKAHRFLLPSILNPKNHQIPLISIITLPFCLFPPHPLLLSSLPPCVPCYKTPQTDSFTFKCYWTTRCFCAQMLGSLAGTKHLLSLSLTSSSTRSSLLVFSSWRQFEFGYCLFVHS